MFEVFWQFLKLGCYSFGGPAAHIGYFRKHFVEELKWLDDYEYAQFVAMSQFLPGPGSSQVGFAIGLHRAGILGGVSAFIGFTLPSFVLLVGFALSWVQLSQLSQFNGLMHGLKLLSVVVVADACVSMARNFCGQWQTRLIAMAVALVLVVWQSLWVQVLALIIAGGLGAVFLKEQKPEKDIKVLGFTRLQKMLLLVFVLILLLTFIPELRPSSALLSNFLDFYQAGSLVFGGGHVVLPLLQSSVGSQLPADTFLSGYAVAQAIPGPMFTFASYLGAQLSDQWPVIYALVATLGVFLPGFILVYVLMHQLQRISGQPMVKGAIVGVNASVVGLLLATLYSPVLTNSVHSALDVALVIAGIGLMLWKRPAVHWMVLTFILIGLFLF